MIRPALLPVILFLVYGCSAKVSPIAEGRGITSEKGMVVSAHPESSRIGAEILRKGGNAIDAGVAVEFALAVCYPEAGNIGGGGFWIVRMSDGSFSMLDYREKAPLLSNRDMYLDRDGNVTEGLSTRTLLASGVPGTVDGMIRIHSRSGIMPFREVIQPAIDLARRGFPLTAGGAASLNSNRETFLTANPRGTSFVGGEPWKEGDTLRQPELAETLELIRDHGREGFYSGKTARLIAEEMKRGGGIITEEDLAGYSSVFREPLSAGYRNYRITTVSPPSGGGALLIQLLRMTESRSLAWMGFHSVGAIHLITEAEKRAFADRAEHLGDPDYMNIPVALLMGKEYNDFRMSDFSEERATPSRDIGPGNPILREAEETTHYSVVDAMGNAVAGTTTLNGSFGSSIVVGGAGFLLNNQMDDFSLKPGFPNMYGLVGGEVNSIQPGKRMLSSMTPVIVEKEGNLHLVLGSPGGSTIPTSVFQVLINVTDFGMPVQEAVDAGRFHHQWLPDLLYHERNSLDSLTIASLAKMGHLLRERSSLGRVNAIQILPDGKRAGGADRRGENTACGY